MWPFCRQKLTWPFEVAGATTAAAFLIVWKVAVDEDHDWVRQMTWYVQHSDVEVVVPDGGERCSCHQVEIAIYWIVDALLQDALHGPLQQVHSIRTVEVP